MGRKKGNLKKLLVSTGLVVLVSCGQVQEDSNSEILVTDVVQTSVKRQAIGTCWLFAQASWIESLFKTATGEDVDVSESYWTYWHWYHQILNSAEKSRRITDIQVGGTWDTAQDILRKHGVMTEADFIPEDAGKTHSFRLVDAEESINRSLHLGYLKDLEDRTPDKVMRALNLAFEVNMTERLSYAIPADMFPVTTGKDNKDFSAVADVIDNWKTIYVNGPKKDFYMKVVMQALNDGHPVVMMTWVDFRFHNTKTQTFEGKMYNPNDKGAGGHLVVLEDYSVNHPELGVLGEGDMDDETKARAVEGELLYFKAKNSWGTNRPSRGITDGYIRFTKSWLLEASSEQLGYMYTRFFLPEKFYNAALRTNDISSL